jgi:hypothetical protein
VSANINSRNAKPFPINPACCYGLDDAAKAYASVLRGTAERVLLKP